MRFLVGTLFLLSSVYSHALTSSVRPVKGDFNESMASWRNFAPNPSAIRNTTGWTGSSVTVARDTDSADQFEGIASFTLTSATNPATFCTADITVPKPYADGINGEASVYFKGDASKWQLEVRSSGGSSVLADVDLTSVSGWTRASLNYPIGTSYRICVSSNASSPANINVAGFYWGLATNLSVVTPITSWASFTPTGSLTTAVTHTGYKRRVGDELHVYGKILFSGANTQGAVTLNVPSECVIDTAKIPSVIAQNSTLGTVIIRDDGTDTFPGGVGYTSTTVVNIRHFIDGASGANNVTTAITNTSTPAPMTFASGDEITYKYAVPCVGWQAEQAVRSDQSGLTPWVSFTPTGSWSTNTTYVGQWRRVGDQLELRYEVRLTGAPTSATLTLDLPAVCGGACVIDTAKLTSTDVQQNLPGSTGVFDSGTATYNIMSVAYNSTTTIAPKAASVSGAVLVNGAINATSPITFANGDRVYVNVSLPIVGWTQTMPAPLLVGSVTSNSSGLERSERARVTTICTSTPCTIADQSGSWLTSVSRASTGVYTINIATGIFSAAPTCEVSVSDAGFFPLLFVGTGTPSATAVGFQTRKYSDSSAMDSAFNIRCQGPR
jgi:hypothetical protein